MIDMILSWLLKRPAAALLLSLLVFTNVGWAWDAWSSARELREAREAQSDLILDIARADSIANAVGERNENLLSDIQEMSTSMDGLARNLEATESENVRLTELLASARSEMADTGVIVRVDTVRTCVDCLIRGDQVSGVLTNDVFTIDWTFTALNQLRADIMAEIRARMVSVELPDDRIAVFAESMSPSVDIQVERFEFTPPSSPDISFHWGTAWRVGLGAYGLGMLTWELVR